MLIASQAAQDFKGEPWLSYRFPASGGYDLPKSCWLIKASIFSPQVPCLKYRYSLVSPDFE